MLLAASQERRRRVLRQPRPRLTTEAAPPVVTGDSPHRLDSLSISARFDSVGRTSAVRYGTAWLRSFFRTGYVGPLKKQ